MFVNKRKRGKENYIYLEHSYRLGKKVKKISFYVPKTKPFNFSEFRKINSAVIDKLANDRVAYYKKKFRLGSFYHYDGVVENIEKIHATFHILFSQLDKKSQEEIIEDFFRKFIVNSMEMEGATITYEVAEKVDKSKLKKIPENVDPVDVNLYKNIKTAYGFIKIARIRRASSIAKIHGIMYNNIYSFAGKFKKEHVSFGFVEKAKVSPPKYVIRDLTNAINNYTKNKKNVYPFEAVLRFHIDYQGVHPFKDGNSRLGRLIITHDLLSRGYPPPILKTVDSRNYRKYLVESINHKHTANFFKLYYKKYKTTWQKFFQPILKEKLENSLIFKQTKS